MHLMQLVTVRRVCIKSKSAKKKKTKSMKKSEILREAASTQHHQQATTTTTIIMKHKNMYLFRLQNTKYNFSVLMLAVARVCTVR